MNVVCRSLVGLLRPLKFRGKARLVAGLFDDEENVVAKIFGYWLPLDLRDHIDRNIFQGTFEPLNTVRFQRLLRPGMTVIDVGANIGYFTLLAARCVGPSGRVLAVEPHPINYDILAQAVASNGIRQVETVATGFSDHVGEGTVGMFHDLRKPNRTATMLPTVRPGFRVPTTTLDEFVAARKIPQIDLLKVDVDGFELRVLDGAKKTLRSGMVRHLLIELEDPWLRRSQTDAVRMAGKIASYGYVDISAQDQNLGRIIGETTDRLFVRRS